MLRCTSPNNLFNILANSPLNVDKNATAELVTAHCIAADFGMFGGIAAQFVANMDMKHKLFEWAKLNKVVSASNPFYKEYGDAFYTLKGTAVKIDNVYNLVTKMWTYEKPDYKTLLSALNDLKRQMRDNDEQFLAIPKLGCGIDELDWEVVNALLASVFYDTGITIIISDPPKQHHTR